MDTSSIPLHEVAGMGTYTGSRLTPAGQTHGCAHEFDGHIVVATTGNPEEGGIIICQVKGCPCYATWGTAWHNGDGTDTKNPATRVPDEFEINELRTRLQTEEES